MKAQIAVLVASRIDPVSARIVASRNDAVAAALALSLLPADRIATLSAGDLSDAVARDYLALGLQSIELLDAPNADAVDTLAEAVADIPRVLTGLRSEAGIGSGTLPYALAHRLGRPVLAGVVALKIEGESTFVTLACPKGARRHLRVEGAVVLAVSPTAPATLRHSWRDQLQGRVVRRSATPAGAGPSTPVGTGPATPIGTAHATPPGTDQTTPDWRSVPTLKGLQVLAAQAPQAGHSRMARAVGGGAAAAGGQILTEGSAHDKARAVFDYLRSHALLDF